MVSRFGVLIGSIVVSGLSAGGTVYLVGIAPAAKPIVVYSEASAIRNVPWFKLHTAERDAKLTACQQDNPGLGQFDPECENAVIAQQRTGNADFLRLLDAAGK